MDTYGQGLNKINTRSANCIISHRNTSKADLINIGTLNSLYKFLHCLLRPVNATEWSNYSSIVPFNHTLYSILNLSFISLPAGENWERKYVPTKATGNWLDEVNLHNPLWAKHLSIVYCWCFWFFWYFSFSLQVLGEKWGVDLFIHWQTDTSCQINLRVVVEEC